MSIVAAEEHNGHETCEYEDCRKPADWLVEVKIGYVDGVPSYEKFYTCNDCSKGNRLWIEENEIYRNSFSQKRGVIPE